MTRLTFHRCPDCERILSIPETVERFCERCSKTIVPETVKEAA